MEHDRDEKHFLELLSSTQNGIENAKVFLQAVSAAETGDPAIEDLVSSTAKLLEQFEHQTDQLWACLNGRQRTRLTAREC